MVKEFSNKDMATMTGLAGPTIRKYSQYLERYGVLFNKTENGHRIFYPEHARLFKEMKALSDRGTMPLERIAEIVAGDCKRYEEEGKVSTSDGENTVSVPATTELEPLLNQHIGELKEFREIIKVMADKLNMMDDIERELKEVKEENRKMHEMMDRRFMESVRQLQEFKQSLIEAATAEEKKKPWWKVWGK